VCNILFREQIQLMIKLQSDATPSAGFGGCRAALSIVDRARAAWVYGRAIDAWYGWGAMATSGGDGAARAPRTEAALARHAVFLAGIRA
jgi:hypothetical protein